MKMTLTQQEKILCAGLLFFCALFFIVPNPWLVIPMMILLGLLESHSPELSAFFILPSLVIPQTLDFDISGHVYEMRLTEIFIAILFFLMIFHHVRQRRKWLFPQWGYFGLLLILLMAVGLVWSQDPVQGVILLRTASFAFALFVVVGNAAFSSRSFVRALWALPFAGTLVALQVLIHVWQLGGFQWTIPREAIQTPIGAWVLVSAVIVVTVPLTIALATFAAKKFGKGATVGLAIVNSAVSIVSLGRGEILSLLVGMGVFVSRHRGTWKRAVGAVVILGILLLLPFSSFTRQTWERFRNLPSSPTVSYRIQEYRVAGESFLDQPVFGVGTGAAKLVHRLSHPCHCTTEFNNIFLHVAMEFGITGLLFLFFAGVVFLREARKVQKKIRSERERLMFSAFLSTGVIMLVNGVIEVTFVALPYALFVAYIFGLWGAFSRLILKKYA